MGVIRVICVFIIFAAASSAQAKLLVLASIKPLALIAGEIVKDTAQVDTLLPVSASPHDYPLKVSDYSRLQTADLLVWVGPELESFLHKPIKNLPAEKVITAYKLAHLHWPQDAQHEQSHHHHEQDPHLWLDPRNAVIIAKALTEKLAQIDPRNKAFYDENLIHFSRKMLALDEGLMTRLKPLAARGFAVYHEGYAHFVNRYGLRQLDYVTFTPEQRPGAKHLQQLRDVLAKEGVCLFLEPYYEKQSVRDLATELHLRVGVLDALGSDETISDYSQLMSRMGEAFVSCLKA